MFRSIFVALSLLSFAFCLPATAKERPPGRAEAELKRPMAWLLAAQNANGGWGAESKTAPDVATTSLSGITLLRYGHTYSQGEHKAAARKAIRFVVEAVERSPADSSAVQAEGTQPQAKLGRFIDTYLAAQFLAEALPTIDDPEVRSRTGTALDMLVGKVQALQRKDGSFSGEGWAPVLSSAFATGGLYAAQRAGSSRVKSDVLSSADKHMEGQYDSRKRTFKTQDSAGVALYSAAGALGSGAAKGSLDGEAAKAAREQVNSEPFVRGFGSYGGEEHVSYMMTSEALAKVGGAEWKRWDASIRGRLAGIQREDGTWRGDHCITSTSFCTAASLITLAIKPPPPVQGRRADERPR